MGNGETSEKQDYSKILKRNKSSLKIYLRTTTKHTAASSIETTIFLLIEDTNFTLSFLFSFGFITVAPWTVLNPNEKLQQSPSKLKAFVNSLQHTDCKRKNTTTE